MNYVVTLTSEEEKALLSDMISIQEWLNNAIHNKARQCMDAIVLQYSDRQPEKIPHAEKVQIVRTAQVKTVAEKSAEIEES